MKSLILSFITCGVLLAENALPMPPMPPMMDLAPKKEQGNHDKKEPAKGEKKGMVMPKECELLPPMVILLPPPMENMVGKCKNELYKPKMDSKNIEKLFGKGAKVSSIEAVEGFNNLYEVKVDKTSFLCNKDLTICFAKGEEKRVKK